MVLVYNLQISLGRLLLLTLSFISMYMCTVCIHMCMYVHICMGVCMCKFLCWGAQCTCGELKLVLDMFLNHSLLYWGKVSPWVLSSLIPDSLASQLAQAGILCLFLLNAEITSSYHTSLAFLWVLGIWTPIFMLVQQAFFTDHLSRVPLVLFQRLRGGKLWSRPLT